jgi:2-oxoglutarate dehydrogenase E2 component (dihydrolipoamide succinyltransferase)
MPKLGESLSEGTVLGWLKNVGDYVKKDENIVTVSTEKLEAEIPSPVNGRIISINITKGMSVKTETILAVIMIENSKTKNKKVSKKIKNQNNYSITNSPILKLLFLKNKINKKNLQNTIGSGFKNRITKINLLKHIGYQK